MDNGALFVDLGHQVTVISWFLFRISPNSLLIQADDEGSVGGDAGPGVAGPGLLPAGVSDDDALDALEGFHDDAIAVY